MNVRLIALAALLCAAAAFGAGWYVRGQGAEADLAAARLDRAADATGVALATAQAASADLSRYTNIADRLAAIDKKHQEEMADAKTEADRVARGLLDGTVQLRDAWATCRATSDVLVTAGVGQSDAAARDRAASAGRIVQAARDADATIRGLQAIVDADRSGP